MPVGASRKKLARGPFHSLARIIGASAAVMLALQAAGSASAQTADASQQKFAKAFVAAIRSHDSAKVQALEHPASRACVNDETRAYFDWGVANELETGGRTSGPYRVTRFGPADGQGLLGFLPAGAFSYPVKPTHEIQIDTQTGEHGQILLVRELAKANGRWFVVDPCPNAAGLKFFAEQKALGDRQQAESLRLLAAMPETLRQELAGLLAQGQVIDATHRYEAATGADLTTAVGVVQQLRKAG
jgi:hypothetical protein